MFCWTAFIPHASLTLMSPPGQKVAERICEEAAEGEHVADDCSQTSSASVDYRSVSKDLIEKEQGDLKSGWAISAL